MYGLAFDNRDVPCLRILPHAKHVNYVVNEQLYDRRLSGGTETGVINLLNCQDGCVYGVRPSLQNVQYYLNIK